MKNTPLLLASMLALIACAAPPKQEVTVMDFRDARGAYILVYSTDSEFRRMFEDQLVKDLAARDIVAFPSHPDLPDVNATNRENLIGAARNKKAMFILVAEEVKHGQKGVVPEGGRITHEHPTLRDFYAHTRPADHEHDPGTQVFVEVSGFLIQGEFAKLIWSGTTWSLRADNQYGRVTELSATIANAIEDARRKRSLGFE